VLVDRGAVGLCGTGTMQAAACSSSAATTPWVRDLSTVARHFKHLRWCHYVAGRSVSRRSLNRGLPPSTAADRDGLATQQRHAGRLRRPASHGPVNKQSNGHGSLIKPDVRCSLSIARQLGSIAASGAAGGHCGFTHSVVTFGGSLLASHSVLRPLRPTTAHVMQTGQRISAALVRPDSADLPCSGRSGHAPALTPPDSWH
jgi:hypothetical protein